MGEYKSQLYLPEQILTDTTLAVDLRQLNLTRMIVGHFLTCDSAQTPSSSARSVKSLLFTLLGDSSLSLSPVGWTL